MTAPDAPPQVPGRAASATGTPLLGSPLTIGAHTLRNRLVFAAHLTNFATEGLPTPRHSNYYAARAAGGVALIVTEEHSVHPSDWPYEKVIRGYLPEVVEGYRRITGQVHEHGAVILAQLNHNGAQGSSRYSRRPLWAPSAVADPLFREVPVAIVGAQIAQLIDGYALVARHCREGGFDGVELQCSQSSILRAFLATGTNKREDQYGGALGNRARLLLEVIGAVRAALGPNLLLGVRLTGEDGTAGGVGLHDACAVAQLIEATGQVDYLNTSVGVATESLYLIEASMATAHGYNAHVPRALRAHVSMPVVGIGRFTEPQQVEHALARGDCDLVGVVRGQIADPDFARKALTGRAGAIRTCTSCNQECIGRVGLNRTIGCVHNPHVDRAGTVAVPLPRSRRTVAVIGGGPAGLQAAATAAQAGHRVTLYERAEHFGGQVRIAATAPGRGELLGMVRPLVEECRRSGVRLRTGVAATAAEAMQATVVIVATGARPARPGWARHPDSRVVDVRDVLEGRARPSGTVLIVDELGFHQATSTAELLSQHGCAVTICTSAMVVGQDLGLTLDLERWRARAHRAGIATLTDVVPLDCAHAERISVTLLHHPTGVARTFVCDWVVCAAQQVPQDELWRELAGQPGLQVHRIGDALSPRRAHAAVLDGQRVGASL